MCDAPFTRTEDALRFEVCGRRLLTRSHPPAPNSTVVPPIDAALGKGAALPVAKAYGPGRAGTLS